MQDLTIIQSVLYTISIALVLLSLYRYRKYKSLELWLEVPATIKSITEENYSLNHNSIFHNSSLDFHYPQVEYSYQFKNKEYESRMVSLNLSNIWIYMRDTEVTERYNNRFWYTWKQGLKLSAFVNPRNPKESVLINKMSSNLKSTNVTLIAAGILVALFSYYASPYIAENLI